MPATNTKLAALEAYLLGTVPYAQCERLQRRLVYETTARPEVATLLLTEHSPIITVGRNGSASEIQLDQEQLTSRSLEVVWTNRGGGVLAHLPGQLAVYPIVSLDALGLRPGDYLQLLQESAQLALADSGLTVVSRPGRFGLWGRAGQVAAVGIAVRRNIAYHGLFVNVAPAMQVFGFLETDPIEGTRMDCLMNQRQEPVKMTLIRSALVRRLSEALSCDRYHVHSSHPLLATV